MTTASVRDLRYDFKKIERLLRQGEEIQITNRRRIIARLISESAEPTADRPDNPYALRDSCGEGPGCNLALAHCETGREWLKGARERPESLIRACRA